jgi:hypothetical protein
VVPPFSLVYAPAPLPCLKEGEVGADIAKMELGVGTPAGPQAMEGLRDVIEAHSYRSSCNCPSSSSSSLHWHGMAVGGGSGSIIKHLLVLDGRPSRGRALPESTPLGRGGTDTCIREEFRDSTVANAIINEFSPSGA